MKIFLPALLAIGLPTAAVAADVANGDELHFESCTGCHDDSVYTRADRKVRNLEQLGRQVRFCRDAIGVTWFDDEVDDVIAYLNATYYRF